MSFDHMLKGQFCFVFPLKYDLKKLKTQSVLYIMYFMCNMYCEEL